jgi:hypothetical protein
MSQAYSLARERPSAAQIHRTDQTPALRDETELDVHSFAK